MRMIPRHEFEKLEKKRRGGQKSRVMTPKGLKQRQRTSGLWYNLNLNLSGEVPERPKGHDWKSCVGAKTSTEGSNPSLSARNFICCMQSGSSPAHG